MSRRNRFDIAAPDADLTAAAPVPVRRGPMAAAVRETAEAVARRAAAEAAIRAENDQLAADHVAARCAGLVLEAIDPDAVDARWLHRDRSAKRDPEIDALKASIRAVGLSNPIRVARTGEGTFALVQGWRRLSAWRELRAETGDPAFDRIPAAVDADGALTDAYRRMVDENLVRRDVSFAEMAALARTYAEFHADGDVDAAVDALFGSAPPQKRSYVRAFCELLDRLEKLLTHPEAIPRALGLAVRKRLRDRPETGPALYAALRHDFGRSAERELAILLDWVEGRLDGARAAAPRSAGPRTAARRLRLPDGAGEARAADGRLTLTAPRDFSAVDPARLTAALETFLKLIED
jgi:ParB family chromosome partitioning protein